ncbi:AAA family ATPase [Streptomyces sp. NPDC093109]|uniref:AAA family ATPase n=1 Tax=Streptomyces sp. NPDC093109 TaxID=3154977 RepID=UPI0034503B51
MDLGQPSLYVLIGAAGSGKSRIAAAFPARWRLELDACRERVADRRGDQASTPDAVRVFDTVLAGRLARHLPTVVDSTNTEERHRAGLVERAHAHRMPAVAIVASTPLEVCQARQDARPADRRVPPGTVARQHQGVPGTRQLRAEGFDEVHDAAELDLMGLLLARSTDAGPDPLADVRTFFGDGLAAVFAWDTGGETGTFAVAGQEITVRQRDDGDPFDHHWQARTACPDGCPGPAWVKVTGPADLLDVYKGGRPDDVWCEGIAATCGTEG